MAAVKTLGRSGELDLGDEYAGKPVLVDEIEPGVWIVKVDEAVAENSRWLEEPEARAKLDRAIVRARTEPFHETDLDELEERLRARS